MTVRPFSDKEVMTLIGTLVLDRYEVLELKGEGAQGQLYSAWDTREHEVVAIKFQSAQFFENDSEYGERTDELIKEADSGEALSGIPGVPKILDRGSHGNRYFIVMEFVDGALLYDTMVEARPLKDPATIAAIICQLCEILDEVHLRNLVHRDVKPDNIMVDPEGRLWLLDFGFAVEADTLPDLPCGTPGYTAPEQSRPEGRRVTPRADVFALGCLLLEMTVMCLPYAGRIERPTPGHPVLPADCRNLTTAPFLALALRMVELDPELRPGVREVLDHVRPSVPAAGALPPAKPLCPDPTEYYRRRPPRM
ncbi:serine/threonine-protein kinase [Streptomyces niveus]|uniref:serine/threonine-protein kinase n=1 Tax=Streptomyces niveus TaxID=193462 RepID=UPI003721C5A6